MRYYYYAIISTNGMNVDDELELSRILACTHAVCEEGMAPGLRETKWHPERGATAECGLEETFSKGPLHCLNLHVVMGVGKMRPRLAL